MADDGFYYMADDSDAPVGPFSTREDAERHSRKASVRSRLDVALVKMDAVSGVRHDAGLTMTVTVDRKFGTSGKYEYIIYDGDDLVARQGSFSNYSAAKSAGLKKGKELEASNPQRSFKFDDMRFDAALSKVEKLALLRGTDK